MVITSESLDIKGDQIPIEKFYEFGGVTYIFKFKFNTSGEFFTIEIRDQINQIFLYSNKIVLNQNINDSILSPIAEKIIPLNLDILIGITSTEEITTKTLGDKIKLYTDITES